MNKIRVIDLLNMISKDEDIPKRIKYCGVYYKYDLYDYFNEDEDDGDDEPLSSWIDFSKKDLNDELEIIEEDKLINPIAVFTDNGINYYLYNKYGTKCSLSTHDKVIVDKINEIIDKINLED